MRVSEHLKFPAAIISEWMEVYPSFRDYFEYDGGTNIRLTRKQSGQTILQDWLMFDTVEAALEYFNDCCGV